MTVEDKGRFDRLMELFEAALARPESEREAWIASQCAGDEELARELHAMLAHDSKQTPTLALGRGLRLPVDASQESSMPRLRGEYRIVRKLGEGGMGAVYEAEQSLPRRRVALKVLLPGRTSRWALARFEKEAHILGRLHHPDIAQVFEVGLVDIEGVEKACLVMELVDGKPLNEFVESHALDLRARAALLARIGAAVQHAHGRRVIHRDLKPANILVTATGQPKVLDFGVARWLDGDGEHERTIAGQLLGTLAYMSPEQVDGDPTEIDARTDVYSLGVLAYELFTGVAPVPVEGRPITDALNAIREKRPAAPSSIRRSLPRDLDAICLKALEKDRDRRYSSAAELSADLRRFLDDEPVTARAPSAWYVLGKALRRHRTVSALVALVVVVLAAFAFQSRRFAVESREEARLANLSRGRVLGAFDRLTFAEQALWTQHDAHADERSEWAMMELYARHPSDLALRDLPATISVMAATPDEGVLFLGSHDGVLRSYDRRARSWRRYDKAIDGGLVAVVVLSPERVALGDTKDSVTALDLRSGERVWTRSMGGGKRALIAAALEPRFIAGDWGAGRVALLDPASGEVRHELNASELALRGLAVRDDGARIAASDGVSVRLFDSAQPEEPRLLWRSDVAGAAQLAFERGGSRIAVLADEQIVLVESSDGRESARFAVPGAGGAEVTFMGELVVVSGALLPVAVDVRAGQVRALPTAAAGSAFLARLMEGGRTMIAAELSGCVRLWDLDGRRAVRRIEPSGAPLPYAFLAPDRDVLVTYSEDSAVQIRRLGVADDRGGELLAIVPPTGARHQSVRIDSLGKWCAVLGDDGEVQMASLDGGERRLQFRLGEYEATGVRFDPRGERATFTLHGGGAQIWRIDPPQLERALETDAPSNGRLSYSPDGRAIAIAMSGGRIRAWDSASGATLAQWNASGAVSVIEWLWDDSMLIGDYQGLLERRASRDGRVLARFEGHSSAVTACSLAPNGRWVATSSFDGRVRLWELSNGRELAEFDAGAGASRCVRFDAVGDRLWAHFADGVTRCWDLDELRARVERNRPPPKAARSP